MIFDISEVEAGTELRAAVCIIGAGAAGITLARRLAARGLDVLLLESGGLQLEGKIQALCEGQTGPTRYLPLQTTRLRYLGGTTNHWEGQSLPLDPLDFEPRAWVANSGWPIPYAEYQRYLPDARAFCNISNGTYDYPQLAKSHQLPGFPELPGFEPVLFRYSEPLTHVGDFYRRELETTANLRCCLHANCLRLTVDRNGDRVSAAEVGSLDGRRVRVVANRFVLAAGGIENSRLLLLSRRPSGIALGNEHDLVGRFVMEHPNIDLPRVALSNAVKAGYLRAAAFKADGARFRRDARLTAAMQGQEQILNHTLFLREVSDAAPDVSLVDRLLALWNSIGGKSSDSESSSSNQSSNFVMRIRLEHAPRADSRVTLIDEVDAFGLQRVKLDLRFGELERRTLAQVRERLGRALGQVGLGRLWMESESLDRWVESAGWQYHHMGGTRMHADPRQGVVDINSRVHGLLNLYVAGSSVFPTSGQANPTMNLVALTLRLADHLAPRAA